MERLHAPNEFFRIRRLGEGMRAWEELWRLLADGPHRLVKASATSITEVSGAGPVIAATVIGNVVTVARFPSRGQLGLYIQHPLTGRDQLLGALRITTSSAANGPSPLTCCTRWTAWPGVERAQRRPVQQPIQSCLGDRSQVLPPPAALDHRYPHGSRWHRHQDRPGAGYPHAGQRADHPNRRGRLARQSWLRSRSERRIFVHRLRTSLSH
jgi:hypothetical protein